MRSVPECAASEMRPRLWVARPVPSLSPMSASAAKTDQSAAFRWASTPGSLRLAPDGLGRPDERVLPEGAMAPRRPAEGERSDRVELDLGLRRVQKPTVVVHLGGCIAGEEAVALGEEPLERALLGL